PLLHTQRGVDRTGAAPDAEAHALTAVAGRAAEAGGADVGPAARSVTAGAGSPARAAGRSRSAAPAPARRSAPAWAMVTERASRTA
ncbi:MAG TPA: hypothetical protein VM490_19505, partial [Armatimonadaceae bacterium]|nr:hypothetical protein [Armatimonadaceae bacterium]